MIQKLNKEYIITYVTGDNDNNNNMNMKDLNNFNSQNMIEYIKI